MSEDSPLTDTEDLQERLAEVQSLLARHKLVEDLVHLPENASACRRWRPYRCWF
jgi:magnesium transporter